MCLWKSGASGAIANKPEINRKYKDPLPLLLFLEPVKRKLDLTGKYNTKASPKKLLLTKSNLM
jgi:hypothetical protein